MFHAEKNKGIALYLAVLIGSIVMAAGFGASNIFYRELRITRLQFPSLVAFYAADAGTECALYHDIQGNKFEGSPATITCQGNIISNITPGAGSDSNGPYIDYEFEFELSNDVGNACANVRVKKQTVSGDPCTRIDVYGWDAGCSSGSASVERGIVSIDPDYCLIDGN